MIYMLPFSAASIFLLAQVVCLITIVALWRRLRWAEQWMRWYCDQTSYMLPPRAETPQRIKRQEKKKARAGRYLRGS